MKKIFLILLLSVFSLPAGAWVFSPDVAKPGKDAAPYLIHNIMYGKPVRVCVDFIETSLPPGSRKFQKSYMKPGDKRNEYYRRVSQVANDVFNSWINNVKDNISQSGRSGEFKDILPYLNQPKISYVNSAPAGFKNCDEYPEDNSVFDLRLMLETNEDMRSFMAIKDGHLAYASGSVRKHIMIFFHPDYADDSWKDAYWRKHPNKIIGPEEFRIAEKFLFRPTLLHETGHTLGLGDQYFAEADKGDKVYTLADIVPLPAIKSVMQEKTIDEKRLLTCDDAEGIINLIDFYSKDDSSKRRTLGWASLCRNDVVYVESVPYKVTPEEHQTQLNYAAASYAGGVPAHVKRIKAQIRAKAEEQAALAAKAAEEDARAKAEYVKQMVQRDLDYNKRLEEVGYCPICHQHLANEPVTRVSAPRRSITVNGKVVRYEYPYGKCSVDIHAKCWREYKATGMKAPWKAWCSKPK